MARQITKVTPEEFREKPKSAQINLLAVFYIRHCTDELAFQSNGPSSTYWRVRNFLVKKPEQEIFYLYDFVYTIEKKVYLSMTEFYNRALAYRKKLIEQDHQNKVAEMDVKVSKPISAEEFLDI